MRVIAIESFSDGILKTYGEGEYIGDKIPNIDPFNKLKIKNPCILLDNGKYVWGFECWWGDVDKFKEKYKDSIKEEILVDIVNIDIIEETQ
jgi:hypothetical protein